MTPRERRHPKLLDGKRKRRIAAGSGTKVEDVNRLVKMHRQMADMMKAMGKKQGMFSRMFGGGGMPEPSPEMIEQLKKGEMPKGMPALPAGGMPKLPGLGGGGLPGLGGAQRFPGLPGLPGKKK